MVPLYSPSKIYQEFFTKLELCTWSQYYLSGNGRLRGCGNPNGRRNLDGFRSLNALITIYGCQRDQMELEERDDGRFCLTSTLALRQSPQ
jgi:hypothetical protein